jgi:hypothetical protein
MRRSESSLRIFAGSRSARRRRRSWRARSPNSWASVRISSGGVSSFRPETADETVIPRGSGLATKLAKLSNIFG